MGGNELADDLRPAHCRAVGRPDVERDVARRGHLRAVWAREAAIGVQPQVAGLVHPHAVLGGGEELGLRHRTGVAWAQVVDAIDVGRVELQAVRFVAAAPRQRVAVAALRAGDLKREAFIGARGALID